MPNLKHIVILTLGFPLDEADSYTNPALQFFLIAFVKRFNGKISIISFQFPIKAKNYQWNGIDVYALGGNNKKFKKYIIWNKAKRLFKQLNAKLKVTHIHSFWFRESVIVGADLASQFDLPHYCTLMGQDALSGNRYFKKIKNLPNLITLSKFHSEALYTNYQLSSNIIPWGIDIKNQYNLKKTIDLIVVSSLIPLKCVNEFVELVAQLVLVNPHINCKIVGDGPLKSNLEKQITLLGLTQNIQLLGILSYTETQQLIAQSKILVHLSQYESFGMVIIEALAQNTQVIAKPVGIANEIDQIIAIDSISQGVKKIEELLKKEAPILPKYSIEDTVKQYLTLYK